MGMRSVCAWCKQVMGEVRDDAHPSTTTSHGMCARCAALFESFDQQQLGAFLDGINHPVLCVNNSRLVHGNRAAAGALGKDAAAMRGQLGGEVLECVHAREPGGCGHTKSCSACVIRGSVTSTYETGKPVRSADAWQEVFTKEGVQRQHLVISTEKCGEFVLLHVESMVACA